MFVWVRVEGWGWRRRLVRWVHLWDGIWIGVRSVVGGAVERIGESGLAHLGFDTFWRICASSYSVRKDGM